jgi:hypothetical protein
MNNITILTYNLNNEKQPFVTFGINFDTMDFPTIVLDEEIPYKPKDNYIISLTEDYLKTILSNYTEVKLQYVNEIYENNNLTLIFEIFMNHGNSYILTPAVKIWFATLHEIINTNEFCEFKISENVTNQIKRNIGYFTDMGSFPIVCYDGAKMEKIMFDSLFGTSKSNGEGGLKYRFYDYTSAQERAINDKENSKTQSSGILRYVLFEDDLTTNSYNSFLPLTVHRI